MKQLNQINFNIYMKDRRTYIIAVGFVARKPTPTFWHCCRMLSHTSTHNPNLIYVGNPIKPPISMFDIFGRIVLEDSLFGVSCGTLVWENYRTAVAIDVS